MKLYSCCNCCKLCSLSHIHLSKPRVALLTLTKWLLPGKTNPNVALHTPEIRFVTNHLVSWSEKIQKTERGTQNSTSLVTQLPKKVTRMQMTHHVTWYTHCTKAFFTFAMSFSSSVNSTSDVTPPVRKAHGLPGADFHKTLYTEFHLKRTIHIGITERNSITPLTEGAVYCADYQYTQYISHPPNSIPAQLH